MNMLNCPEQSLPTQSESWSDLKAAYRWCDCDQVTFDAVASTHWKQTRDAKPGRYLLISDTTDIDHFNHQATTGLSFLGSGTGYGMQLHSCLMVDAREKQVVGIAGALVNYRQKKPPGESRTARMKRTRESLIWGNVVQQVGPPPDGCQWIHVFDRGGDNYEAMCHLVLNRGDWIIRAGQLNRNVVDLNGQTLPLGDAINHASLLGHYELSLRARPRHRARVAQIDISTCRVRFPQPHFRSEFVKRSGVESIDMNVVIVQELNPPKGIKAIRWVLLTSLESDTFDAAWEVIEHYETRWLIEEYHKALKTGCQVERHALRDASRLEPLTALTTVIAVRLLQLKTISRREPDQSAERRVPRSWIDALQALRPHIKKTQLTVYTFFRELAKLGGFLGRTHDGEPGWQTIWRGYQKLHTVLLGMEIANRSG